MQCSPVGPTRHGCTNRLAQVCRPTCVPSCRLVEDSAIRRAPAVLRRLNFNRAWLVQPDWTVCRTTELPTGPSVETVPLFGSSPAMTPVGSNRGCFVQPCVLDYQQRQSVLAPEVGETNVLLSLAVVAS